MPIHDYETTFHLSNMSYYKQHTRSVIDALITSSVRQTSQGGWCKYYVIIYRGMQVNNEVLIHEGVSKISKEGNV